MCVSLQFSCITAKAAQRNNTTIDLQNQRKSNAVHKDGYLAGFNEKQNRTLAYVFHLLQQVGPVYETTAN